MTRDSPKGAEFCQCGDRRSGYNHRMNRRVPAEYLWAPLLGYLVGAVGGGDGRPSQRATVHKPSPTVDGVCKLTAGLFGVDRSQVNANTSLGDLGADELDFVELVMDLEEHFAVTIPDTTAEEMVGKDWKSGMKNVTVARLASIVDNRRRFPAAQRERGPEQRDEVEAKSFSAQDGSSSDDEASAKQVKVFLNPLVMLLAGAEKQKGRPLTRDEVLEIRDHAEFVMMSPEQAQKFYGALDEQVSVHRIDPDRVWEEWHEISSEVKE
jgi:acyl carrier protein